MASAEASKPVAAGVTLTPAAAEKVAELLAGESDQRLRLRVGARLGRCSGLRYRLSLDEQSVDGDQVTRLGDEQRGFDLVVDPNSLPLLDGARIDYVDNHMGQGFLLDNPNAQGTCSCSDSLH